MFTGIVKEIGEIEGVEVTEAGARLRVGAALAATVSEGDSVSVSGEGKDRAITIRMKYGPNRERTITGITRVSKPGKRVYVGRDEVPRVLGGLGVAILSTSQGVLTDRQARKQGVGGEVIARVW